MFIVDMMRKFELRYPFEGVPHGKYLVPDLSPREEPFTGNWADALAFEFHYSVLPGSIISRIHRPHARPLNPTRAPSHVHRGHDAQVRAVLSLRRRRRQIPGPDLLPREEPFTGEWADALAVEIPLQRAARQHHLALHRPHAPLHPPAHRLARGRGAQERGQPGAGQSRLRQEDSSSA